MAKRSPTSPSTRRLSEVARHVVTPTGIVATGWPAVEARCIEFGDQFDEWQRGAGKLILSKREGGEYAATVGGVTLSIPRQVAKTWLVGRIIFALCTLFPGLRVIWTAHRTRTATNTFNSLKRFAGRKTVAPYIDHIRSTNGEQEIGFANGSVIMFGAREQGFGRGFDEVDIEVFDEAQILTEKALDDMVAATNQSRHPAGALLFYMGTPPRPIDPGEAFKARRAEALAIKKAQAAGEIVESDAVYIECSADPDADPDDRVQWAKANPSFPDRTPLRSMLRLRKNLKSVESWLREALGVWDDDEKKAPSPLPTWSKNGVPSTTKVINPRVSVDFRTGFEQAFAIAVSGSALIKGQTVDVVELARYEFGVNTTWTFEEICAEVKGVLERHDLDTVVVDRFGDGNGALIPELQDTTLADGSSINVIELSLADMRNGWAGFKHGNRNSTIFHITDPKTQAPLNEAVAGAATRKSSGGEVLAQDRTAIDLTSLRAVVASWWVHHRAEDYDLDDSIG